VTLGIYFSEADAQRIAGAIRAGQGNLSLVRALVDAARSAGLAIAPRVLQSEDEDYEDLEELVDSEDFAGGILRNLPRNFARKLKQRFAAWILPALSQWAKSNAEAFIRAAAHPDAGVTVRVRVTGVHGLSTIRQFVAGGLPSSQLRGILRSLGGKPAVSVTVTPGRGRK
jgi:hypothetical protein